MGEKEINDRELVNRILAGDKDALGEFLLKDCYPIFFKILRDRLSNLDLKADDLISDFYIYLYENDWKRLRGFRFESKLRTWINLVASRYLMKKYKKELKENARKNTPIAEGTLSVFEHLDKKMTKFELTGAIGKLPNERDRRMLEYSIMGFKTDEIASLLKTSNNNVYVIRNRAIKNLKRLLNDGK